MSNFLCLGLKYTWCLNFALIMTDNDELIIEEHNKYVLRPMYLTQFKRNSLGSQVTLQKCKIDFTYNDSLLRD